MNKNIIIDTKVFLYSSREDALMDYFRACEQMDEEPQLIDIEKILNEPKTNINFQDTFGNTALIRASRYGHTKIAELLINKNADLNIVTNDWINTALHKTAQYGFPEIAEMLINAGADTEIKNKEGFTPLEIAEKNYNDNTEKYSDEYKKRFKKIIELLNDPLIYQRHIDKQGNQIKWDEVYVI